MDKIFICHSSNDKEYVRIVARQLGRVNVVLDENTFRPGFQFRDEIIGNLDKTNLFVFIVSKKSLSSDWCQLEVKEAYSRILTGKIKGHLAIIIDKDVSISDLPDWMTSSKAIFQTRPSQATRDIITALYSMEPNHNRRPFVGRQTLLSELTQSLSSVGSSEKKMFIATGLDGVGRRSYLERASGDLLGLTLGPHFSVYDTTGIDDMYVWAANETSDLGSRSDLSRAQHDLRCCHLMIKLML